MKRMLTVLTVLTFFVATAYAEERITGHYCCTLDRHGSLEEARAVARTLAVRDALESSKAFYEPTAGVKETKLTNDIIQRISTGYLHEMKVLEHTETDGQICETIETTISPEEVRQAVQIAVKQRNLELEARGIDNNGCLKILALKKVEDRYGLKADVTVKTLRKTGSLRTAALRKKKPCFRVHIDFFDAGGVPIGGDVKSIHYSSRALIPGEIRKVQFLAPPDTKSFKVWLKQPASAMEETAATITAPRSSDEKDPGARNAKKTSTRRLKGIETKMTDSDLRIHILAGSPITDYRNFFMASPPRLVLDLSGDWEEPKHHVLSVENEIVKKIRLGKHNQSLRVVMDLVETGSPSPAVIRQSDEGLMVRFKKQ